MGELGGIVLLSLAAMANPTLLAAVTVMIMLPSPKRLMLGYLLGAYLTSISVGMLIVFSLHGKSGVTTARTTLSPAEDIVFGLLAIVVGIVLRTAWLERRRENRRRRKEGKPKKESLPTRMLGRGSARITFVVGVLLSFPGASYLVALDQIVKLDTGIPQSALLVIFFCVVQMLLLEVPLIGFVFAPDRTERAVARFRVWLSANGLRVAARVMIVLGALLLVRAAIELITA